MQNPHVNSSCPCHPAHRQTPTPRSGWQVNAISYHTLSTDTFSPSQAGAFAAFSVDILVYPLDTLKTRLQSPDYRRRYLANASSTRSLLAKPAMYRGLYQGVSSAIIATLPSCQFPEVPSLTHFHFHGALTERIKKTCTLPALR